MAAAVPSVARDSTMKITAEEGIAYLKAEGENTLLKAQGLVEDKPAPVRDNTMVGTAKEAEGVLNSMGGAPDADAATRAQQKKIEEISTPSPAKKAKVKRDGTMVATAKTGEEFLERTKKPRKSTGQRQSTIAKCIAESKDLVPDVNVNEGRRTRNAGKTPNPPPAPAKKTPRKKAAPKKKEVKETSEEEEEKEEQPKTDDTASDEKSS